MFFQGDFSVSFTGVQDEYDPAVPNEYEDVLRRRHREKTRLAHEQREMEARRRSRSRSNSSSSSDEDRRPVMGKGAAIAPPKLLMEEDAQPKCEPEPVAKPGVVPVGAILGLSQGGQNQPTPPPGSVASKLMAKMGYKPGAGLGRQEQGMSRALFVEKTSLRGGRIIHEKDAPIEEPDTFAMPPPPPQPLPPQQPNAASDQPMSNADLLKDPTRVVVLRNMVGHGEVDDVLEQEVTEECQKYGKVAKCMVFEIPNARDDEAVRIFVEFERQDGAIKALIALNGRFFGGRNVKASFYNLEKFRQFNLAEPIP